MWSFKNINWWRLSYWVYNTQSTIHLYFIHAHTIQYTPTSNVDIAFSRTQRVGSKLWFLFFFFDIGLKVSKRLYDQKTLNHLIKKINIKTQIFYYNGVNLYHIYFSTFFERSRFGINHLSTCSRRELVKETAASTPPLPPR